VPFDAITKKAVDDYARADLEGDLDDHVQFFSFLANDPALMRRVGEEYFSARYLYKLMEGLRSTDPWARRAQIQLQVQQYASIYEACLHHLLFVTCSEHPEVKNLLQLESLKHYSVSAKLKGELAKVKTSNEQTVVAAVESTFKIFAERVRFEHKAGTAAALGIIEDALAEELKEFYAARNMIHIHAELKKGASWTWELEFAKQAYWRLKKFRDQVLAWSP
jgi:SHS2 domain-containing protein